MCNINEKTYDEKKLFPPILAVDFDGTLVENAFPAIGQFNPDVLSAVLDYKGMGWKIILWSCRTGKTLENAVKACEAVGLTFDAVNDNLPEVREYFGENTRKVFANLYWDDRNASMYMGNIGKPRSLEPVPLFMMANSILVEEYGA